MFYKFANSKIFQLCKSSKYRTQISKFLKLKSNMNNYAILPKSPKMIPKRHHTTCNALLVMHVMICYAMQCKITKPKTNAQRDKVSSPRS